MNGGNEQARANQPNRAGRSGRSRNRGRGRGRAFGRAKAPHSAKRSPAVADDAAIFDVSVPSNNSRTTSTTLSEMTQARFDQLAVHDTIRAALSTVFKYETMTAVQEQSIPVSLKGGDVLTKARTGTGKTIAFLVPALEKTIVTPNASGVSVLVISPTRELAQQIADEATMLMTYIKGSTIQVVVGGTPINRDLSQMRSSGPPTLLVATPGRLIDHLTTSTSGFAETVKQLQVLVLDEADRLLDMGFAPDLKKILQFLPPTSHRQTLLFSATMPSDVKNMAKMALQPDYTLVDCVGEGDNTHMHVPQSVLVTPLEEQISALGVLLMQCVQVANYKVIVFFTTAKLTQFYSELFEAMGRPVLEIHSRKSQSHRTRVSDTFRSGSNLIMFTSDVTARGLDYPDVTTVMQVGLPSDKAQYVHRIGRTARAGKGGNGVLLLADYEADAFLRKVSDLPLQKMDKLSEQMLSAVSNGWKVAMEKVPYGTISGAYQSFLGFYNSNMKALRMNREQVVALANEWASSIGGLSEAPALQMSTVAKMGLQGVAGVRVDSDGAGWRKRGARTNRGGRGRARSTRGNGRAHDGVSKPGYS